MQGSKMQHTVRMEQFQTAFIHALAAVNGWRISKPDPDYDGVDMEISGTCALSNDNFIFGNPRIDIQMKATSGLKTLKNGRLVYDLETKNYNQLIDRYSCERYLFILDIPKDYTDWCGSTRDFISLHNRCYWISLKSQPPTTNKSRVRIKIPSNQVLTPEVLDKIMYAAAEGKVYVQC